MVVAPVIFCVAERDALPAINVVIVVAKFGSSPSANASSFNVSNVAGALSTKFAMDVSTYVLLVKLSPVVGTRFELIYLVDEISTLLSMVVKSPVAL